MRGTDMRQEHLFSYLSCEARVSPDHPLRPVREMLDAALKLMSPTFEAIYASTGRPSIAPEKLIRALLLQVLYSVRSERLLIEQLQYNLLFRWFVGLSMDEPIWNHSVFSKNRERLIQAEVVRELLARILQQAEQAKLLSDEHFSVDGTLIDAWASLKSFRAKDEQPPFDDDPPGRNPEVDFHGQKRSNATHESSSDADARLACKGPGQEAKLRYGGHVLMENRSGLTVNACAALAAGSSEREQALQLFDVLPPGGRKSVGADKGFDTFGFVAACRARNITPHVAQNSKRRGGSAIDARTTRHEGYQISQIIRKCIEEGFGWAKTIGLLGRLKLRGLAKVDFSLVLTFIAYDLVRMRNLLQAST